MVLDTMTHILAQIEERHFAAAEEQLRRLTAKSTKDGPLHALRALCLLELERWQDAIEVARYAVSTTPHAAYCHWAFAIVRLHCHEFRKARVAAAKAVGLDPANADYLFVLARAQAGEGNWNEALAALENALLLDADHEGCRTLRDLILELRETAAHADGEFLAALRQIPENAIARAGRGWVALHVERAGAASARSDRALRLDPPSGRKGLVAALKAKVMSVRVLPQPRTARS